jgi:3,4-dihydroxy 2-butanone 4-phosphate synthase/GTP cyclohydrolase II
VHVQNTLSDLFGAQMEDTGWPLRDAMRRVAEHSRGVIVVLGQHESPKDLVHRIQNYNEHKKSGEPLIREVRHELRTHGIGAQILTDLGVRRMRVLSAPMVVHGLSGFGLEVVEYVGGDEPSGGSAQVSGSGGGK